MKMEKIKKPCWHPLNKLDAVRQFVMTNDTRHVLENWGIKYLDLRVDMRTGQFLIKEGNTDKPSFLQISNR